MTPDSVMQLVAGALMLAGGVAGLVKARARHGRSSSSTELGIWRVPRTG